MKRPADPQILSWRKKRDQDWIQARRRRSVLKEAIALFSGDTELAYRYLEVTKHPRGRTLLELLATHPYGVRQVIRRDKARVEKGKTVLAV